MSDMTGYRGVIFDIDGVLTFRGVVYPGAVELIRTLRGKGVSLRFLTNSTLKSRASCAEKLRRSGFDLNDDEVVTASYATARYLEALNPRSCWVMVDGEGLDEFRQFNQNMENPEYIVIGDNRSRFDFDHLNKVVRLLRKGAHLIAMQSELLDTSMGDVELNVGSWVGMLERASGTQAASIGKPNAYAFELTLRMMALPKEDVLVVGDRLGTDILGAQRLGMHSALIKTGEYDPGDLDGSITPDYIFSTVAEILGLFR
jgi:HAD superfamily hydrolase (TIGR01458 family)